MNHIALNDIALGNRLKCCKRLLPAFRSFRFTRNELSQRLIYKPVSAAVKPL